MALCLKMMHRKLTSKNGYGLLRQKGKKTWIVQEIPVEIWQLSVYIATIRIGDGLMFKSVNDVNTG